MSPVQNVVKRPATVPVFARTVVRSSVGLPRNRPRLLHPPNRIVPAKHIAQDRFPPKPPNPAGGRNARQPCWSGSAVALTTWMNRWTISGKAWSVGNTTRLQNHPPLQPKNKAWQGDRVSAQVIHSPRKARLHHRLQPVQSKPPPTPAPCAWHTYPALWQPER